MKEQYFIYIMTNRNNTVLYTGVTNNLERRVNEHKEGSGGTFTKNYNVTKLVYYEIYKDSYSAIKREKQIKAGSRKKMKDMIASMNPEWRDLAVELQIASSR